MTRRPSLLHRPQPSYLVLWLLALALPLTGCASFYRHAIQTESYSLYGDYDPERLRTAGEFIDDGIQAYRKLFVDREHEVPRPRVVYQEDELSRLRIFTAETRQEGFYFPWLRLIHLSPRDNSDQPSELGEARKVILHELAHHFLVHTFPDSDSIYWLNEGLACALEISYFDRDGKLAVPLYHLWLHRQAHAALVRLGPVELRQQLRRLVRGNWFHFHQADDKILHYALSWALTYHLINRQHGNFEDRVAALVELDDVAIDRALPGLFVWLAKEPEEELHRLAASEEVGDWAIARWLDLPRPDPARVLAHLIPRLSDDDEATATPSPIHESGAPPRRVVLLARLLNHGGRVTQGPGGLGWDRRQIDHLRQLLTIKLELGSPSEQIALARELKRAGFHPDYLRPLVTLLDSSDPEVRVAAAQALSRLTNKPTVTRPRFWRKAPVELRTAEILEWNIWLDPTGE